MGNWVRNVQLCLEWAGWLGSNEVDGVFSPITEEAVRDYQQEYGLTRDGIVGPQTKESLWIKFEDNLKVAGYK